MLRIDSISLYVGPSDYNRLNISVKNWSVFENWTIAKIICQCAGFLSSLPYTVGNAFSALMLVIVIKITSLLNHSIGDWMHRGVCILNINRVEDFPMQKRGHLLQKTAILCNNWKMNDEMLERTRVYNHTFIEYRLL